MSHAKAKRFVTDCCYIGRYWTKPRASKMDKAKVRTSKIEIDQEKMEYIDFANNEEITY